MNAKLKGTLCLCLLLLGLSSCIHPEHPQGVGSPSASTQNTSGTLQGTTAATTGQAGPLQTDEVYWSNEPEDGHTKRY